MQKVTPLPVSHASAALPASPADPSAHPMDLQQLTDDLTSVINRLKLYFAIGDMTDAERKRLIGAGVRRYGFLDKTSDLAAAFPQYSPALFNVLDLKDKMRDIEYTRNLFTAANELQRLASAAMALESDAAYKMALRYYASVQQLARQGDHGAQAVFSMLELFFKRSKRNTTEEPTDHELERDFRALLHGRRDGQITVESHTPHTAGRQRTVVDETVRPSETLHAKVTAQIE